MAEKKKKEEEVVDLEAGQEEEEVDFESAEESREQKMEALGSDEIADQWIPHPKVGEEVILEIKRVYKDKNIKAKTKEGRTFETNLSNVDWKPTIEVVGGRRYSCTSWQEWGMLRSILKTKMKDPKMFDDKRKEFVKPLKVRIAHIRDGMQNKDNEPNYEVSEIAEESNNGKL